MGAEGQVVNDCIRWLLLHGCKVHRNNSGALKDATGRWVRFGLKGSGDIVGCSPTGRYLEFECKAGKGEMSEHQIERQKLIMSTGGIYLIVRDSIDTLEKHKERILATPNWSHP